MDDVPAKYLSRSPRFVEATELVSVGCDIHDREALLDPGAARAWLAMREAAAADGVTLSIVSAFRSHERQAEIVARKRKLGQTWEQILRLSAYPGFSEHHTGCAIDVGTPGADDLTERFADSPAFAWLEENAGRFGFNLSYPRENPHGVAYEPWHWRWRK